MRGLLAVGKIEVVEAPMGRTSNTLLKVSDREALTCRSCTHKRTCTERDKKLEERQGLMHDWDE